MDVTFTLNQQKYTIRPSEVPIETSLLVFIRSHARLTGTKFMCLEGGCGACIVNVSGVVTPAGDRRTFAVNSCLWPVYACNGLCITTIEGIGSLKNGYHPIQKALYHFNGTQCGYCSPGMVMTMYSLLEANDGDLTMEQVENSFGGNICRCTGYRPILDAFKSFARDSYTSDIEDLTLDLCHMNKNRPCLRGNCYEKCSIKRDTALEIVADDGKEWLKPISLLQLIKIFTTKTMHKEYMLVAGNTAHGVYRRSENIKIFIDTRAIQELHIIKADERSLMFGGNVSLTELMETLEQVAKEYDNYSYGAELAKHIDLVATLSVRNAGTIAGNLSIKHAHREFPSDIFLLLETIGVQLKIASVDGLLRSYSPQEYLNLEMSQKVILSIVFPKLPSNQFVFRSYKIMPRAQNAQAMVNAAFLFEFSTNDQTTAVKSCRICYGGINPQFIHAEATEQLLTGVEDFYTDDVLQRAIKSLQNEIEPDSILPDPPADYRKTVAIALFYRFFLNTAPEDRVKSEYVSGRMGLERPLSSGIQTFESDEKSYPLTQPLTKYEGLIQCSGEAEYINDLFSGLTVDQELWAAFVPATEVNSIIVSIDASNALKAPGVVAFFSAKDIPGDNSFMPVNCGVFLVVEKEPIFLAIDAQVQFYGQPCGLIVARTMAIAHSAAAKVEITYEKTQENRPIIPSLRHWRQTNANKMDKNESNARKSRQEFRIPPNEKEAMPLVGQEMQIKGDFEIGSQFHMSMEPQTVFCTPNDDGGINVQISTQWLDLSHVAVAKCLNIPQSKVVASFKRVGGGYGAKLSRPSHIACACAIASHLLRMPVRFVMNIESNMTVMGKRYGCAVEYDITVDSATGRLIDLPSLLITSDFGCSLNDDTTKKMTHCLASASYAHANEWKVEVTRLLTDAPSSIPARAPGSTEGTAIIENLIEHIASEVNLDPAQVRVNNFHADGPLVKLFPEFLEDIDYYARRAQIDEFNKQNRWRKRGIGVSIMTFPVVYTASLGTYIVIYHGDGTVSISHGGIEIGQGINTKVAQVVAHIFRIPLDMITVTAHNSIIVANRTRTGSTITSEAVCMAAKMACDRLLERLKPIRDERPDATWLEIIHEAYAKSIELTEKQTFESRDAKSYNVIGCAGLELELDVLTGNVQILRADIHEDTGKSMNPLVDVGQIEGAFIMGVGYWLTEKLDYDLRTGELMTNRTWTYKVPGAKDIPIDFRIKFLQNINNEGIFSSKACGEPSTTLSIVTIFALRHAIDSIREDNGEAKKWYRLGSACTADVILSAAELNVDDFKLS